MSAGSSMTSSAPGGRWSSSVPVARNGVYELDAVERLAISQRLDVALEALALLAVQARELHVLAELPQPRRVGEQLARRADAQRLAHAVRALRRRVERADALDFVAEQLDAQRQFFGRAARRR